MLSDKLFQGGVLIAKLILKNECVGKQNKMCTYSILYRWKWHSMCHVFTTVESETYKLTSPQFMKSHVRVKSNWTWMLLLKYAICKDFYYFCYSQVEGESFETMVTLGWTSSP